MTAVLAVNGCVVVLVGVRGVRRNQRIMRIESWRQGRRGVAMNAGLVLLGLVQLGVLAW